MPKLHLVGSLYNKGVNLYERYALPLNIIILTAFFLELAKTQKHPILTKRSRPTALTMWRIQVPLK